MLIDPLGLLPRQFMVIETFEIRGRGTVALIDEPIDCGIGKPLDVTVTRPDATAFPAVAYQEWLLKRSGMTREYTAFLLMGVAKSDLPVGSSIIVTPP